MPVDISVFDKIEAHIHALSIDEIKQMLSPLMIGYSLRSPILESGTFLYRARKLDSTLSKADGIKKNQLVYPPSGISPLGRVNRQGHSVFYSSLRKESIFYEIPDLAAGDDVIVTFWKTTERMFINNIGYTEFAFRELGATRAVPTWLPQQSEGTGATVELPTLPAEVFERALSNDENHSLKEAFGKYFSKQIPPEDSAFYKVTVALSEIHLGQTLVTDNPLFAEMVRRTPEFAGLLYPSVRMRANGDNLALLPRFVDKNLEFRKAVHFHVDARTLTGFNVRYIDAAHDFDSDANLAWLGRVRGWLLQPQQDGRFHCVAGRDEDGDYITSTDGVQAHYIATDIATGEPLPMR